MAQNIWKKVGTHVPVPREKKTVESKFTLLDWIPGGVIVSEDQYPGQLMNSRRQTIWIWAGEDPMRGDLTAGVKRNTNTPIAVQDAIRSACRAFLSVNPDNETLMRAMLEDSCVRDEWRLYGDETSHALKALLKCAAVKCFGHASLLPADYPRHEAEAIRRLVDCRN